MTDGTTVSAKVLEGTTACLESGVEKSLASEWTTPPH